MCIHILWVSLSFHRKKYCIFIDQLESNPELTSCHAGEIQSQLLLSISFLYRKLYKVSRALIIMEVPIIISNYLVICTHWFTAEIPFCAIFSSGLMTPVFLYRSRISRIRNQVSKSGSPWTQVQPCSLRLCHLGSVIEQDTSLSCSLNWWVPDF